MQIATLSYHYDQNPNARGDNRSKIRQRQILATIANQPKQSKQRRSLYSDFSGHSTVPLPPIKTKGKRPNSIRVKGNSFASSKALDTSIYSYSHQSRSHSRQSNKSGPSIARSRSVCFREKCWLTSYTEYSSFLNRLHLQERYDQHQN